MTCPDITPDALIISVAAARVVIMALGGAVVVAVLYLIWTSAISDPGPGPH